MSGVFGKNYVPADLHHGGILVAAPELVPIDISIGNAIIKEGYSQEMVKEILQNAFGNFLKVIKHLKWFL